MVFWKKEKKKYPLPKFPATVIPTFKSLCALCTELEITELQSMVNQTEQLLLARSEKNDDIDIEASQQLIEACRYLLNRYFDFDNEKKPYIVGAVRYFVVGDDPFDDSIFASGLFDDQRIINFVLEELGVHDRYLYEG